jgi:hypothetical protein
MRYFTRLLITAVFFSAVLFSCEQQTDPRDIELTDTTGSGEPMASLIGTAWQWNAGAYGIRTMRFVSDDLVQFQDQADDSDPWHDYDYRYHPETKKGIIGTALDNSDSIQSQFTVNNDNTRLIFAQWKSYPHGADYTRLE